MSTEKITELEQKLADMQRELEALKSGITDPTNRTKTDIFAPYAEKRNAVDEAVDAFFEAAFSENELRAVSTYYCCYKNSVFQYAMNRPVLTARQSLDDVSDADIAAAMELFTNPRRIAIIKLLMDSELSASEIAQRTGLVGGQLYHHLSCLENAAFVIKIGDKFRLPNAAQMFMFMLFDTVDKMDDVKQEVNAIGAG